MINLAALAAVAALALAQASSIPPRYALDASAPAGRPAVRAVVPRLAQELDAAGWRREEPADVRIELRWTFHEPGSAASAGTPKRAEWCVVVQDSWWDGSSATRRFCVTSPLYEIAFGGFDAKTVTDAIVPGARDALLRSADTGRWILRANGAAARDRAVFRVGTVDAARWVWWSGEDATLSVPRGKPVAVNVGACGVEVTEGRPAVDIVALGTERRAIPRWTVDGRAVARGSIPTDRPFTMELSLLDAAPGTANAIQLPCAAARSVGLTARLALTGFDATPATPIPAPWTWAVQPKGEAGSLHVSLLTSSGNGTELWSDTVAVEVPRTTRAWRWVKGAVVELGALLTALVGIFAALRQLWWRKKGRTPTADMGSEPPG